MLIPHLPDHARLRVIACAPALDDDSAAWLSQALEKLLRQFCSEGRCTDCGIAWDGDRHFVLLSWLGEPLSGCSHDKIGKILRLAEERSGSALLAPPPVVLVDGDAARFLDHAGFRSAVAAGTITDQDEAWDTLAETLGAWRHGARRPIAEHWLAPLWTRARSRAGAGA